MQLEEDLFHNGRLLVVFFVLVEMATVEWIGYQIELQTGLKRDARINRKYKENTEINSQF